MDPSQVLELLGVAIANIDGDCRRQQCVERLKHAPLQEVLARLLAMRREASDVMSVRLITMAREVLSGQHPSSDEFVMLCHTTGFV